MGAKVHFHHQLACMETGTAGYNCPTNRPCGTSTCCRRLPLFFANITEDGPTEIRGRRDTSKQGGHMGSKVSYLTQLLYVRQLIDPENGTVSSHISNPCKMGFPLSPEIPPPCKVIELMVLMEFNKLGWFPWAGGYALSPQRTTYF